MSDSERHLAAGLRIVIQRLRRGHNIIICVGELLLIGAPVRIAWVRSQPVVPIFAPGVDATLNTFVGPLDVHQSSGFAVPSVSFRNTLTNSTQAAPRVGPPAIGLISVVDVGAEDSIRRDNLGLVRALPRRIHQLDHSGTTKLKP